MKRFLFKTKIKRAKVQKFQSQELSQVSREINNSNPKRNNKSVNQKQKRRV